MGYAPVVIHSGSTRVFGEDGEADERAVQTGEALAAQCDHFWGILRTGRKQCMSDGVRREYAEFLRAHPGAGLTGDDTLRLGTWEMWLQHGVKEQGCTAPRRHRCPTYPDDSIVACAGCKHQLGGPRLGGES
jgi:hypothetical protein